MLFIAVIAAAAWVATSSPRLSYFGIQVAVAFCVINLLEFKFQTSLAVARDRVIGILLGLFMMWLFFDHLWSAPAGVEMKRTFIANFRMLAQFAREPISNDIRAAIERTYALRESIDANFDKVRSLADGVLFEFGPSRRKDLQFRDRIRRWQPQLRTLFVMRIASLKYRLQMTGFELPEAVRRAQEAYDERSAGILEHMADTIERNEPQATIGTQTSKLLVEQMLQQCRDESLATLVRGIEVLTSSLEEEIAAEFESHYAP
jgi:multidrug resistance protein MdtO